MNKAVFLDKDGTLVNDVPYNIDPAKVSFCEGVTESLLRLKAAGFKLVMVSNQSGVARGYFSEAQLRRMFDALNDRLLRVASQLDSIRYCPHHPCGIVDKFTTECDCRKPRPGMILKAASELDIDLSSSWMVGDILHDVEAGNRAGCGTILINNGNETEWTPGEFRAPDYIVDNMVQATNLLLSHDRKAAHDYPYYKYH